jgi:hypothetical protein
MFWELVILAISIIILAFDICWQFYVAGMYAPVKARRLILDDPRFKRLERLVVTLESKSTDPDPTGFLRALEDINRRVTELSEKTQVLEPDLSKLEIKIRDMIHSYINSLGDNLRGTINGAIGNLTKEYYGEVGLTEEGVDKEEIEINKEIAKLKNVTLAQEQQMDFYYQVLEPFVGEEKANNMAVGLVMAPKWMKSIVKKKAKSIIENYGG